MHDGRHVKLITHLALRARLQSPEKGGKTRLFSRLVFVEIKRRTVMEIYNRNKINSDQSPGSNGQGKIKTVIQTLL